MSDRIEQHDELAKCPFTGELCPVREKALGTVASAAHYDEGVSPAISALRFSVVGAVYPGVYSVFLAPGARRVLKETESAGCPGSVEGSRFEVRLGGVTLKFGGMVVKCQHPSVVRSE